MPKHEIITLAPPLRGLFRGRAYADKPLDTSELLLNVRPYDVLEDRGRMGSRAGLVKAFAEQLGSGSPIRLATFARTADSPAVGQTTDSFDASPDPLVNWASLTTSALPGGSATRPLPEDSDGDFIVLGGTAIVDVTGRTYSMAFTVPNLVYTAQHTFHALVNLGTPTSYEIICGMDNTTPDEASCVSLVCCHKGNASGEEVYLELWQNRTTLLQSVVLGGITDGTYILRLTVFPSGDGYVGGLYRAGFVYVGMVEDWSGISRTGNRFGLVLHERSEASAVAQCDLIYVQGTPTTAADLPVEFAVFSSAGTLYREGSDGQLSALDPAQDVDLASDVQLHAQPYQQKVIIADYEVLHEQLTTSATSDIASTGANVARLTDTGGVNFVTLGVDADGDVLEVLAITSGAIEISIFPITAVAATTLDITVTGTKAGTNIAYRVVRYPKVYDTALEGGSSALARFPVGATNGGTVVAVAPAGCRSVRLWQNRLVWCNNEQAPHGWWMSAAGYPFLYDYGDTGKVNENGGTTAPLVSARGVAAAVAWTQAEFAGLIGEPLVTVIPITDDLLIFACRTSFYYLRGNPLDGGRMNNITQDIGIVDIDAWCRNAEGRLFAMTPDGLYEITLDGAIPRSRDIIPQELIGLKASDYSITLGFDVDEQNIIISATSLDSGTSSIHYAYSMRTGGFFPDEYQSDHAPMAVMKYQPGGEGLPALVFAGRDGYVRRFSPGAQDDDGTNFETRIRIGPILLGRSLFNWGILHEIVVEMDRLSGGATIEVRVGESPQAAANASARESFAVVAGRNYNRWVRVSGVAAYIDIVGTAGTAFTNEAATITREIKGRLKSLV